MSGTSRLAEWFRGETGGFTRPDSGRKTGVPARICGTRRDHSGSLLYGPGFLRGEWRCGKRECPGLWIGTGHERGNPEKDRIDF